jgi:hypothetical protein
MVRLLGGFMKNHTIFTDHDQNQDEQRFNPKLQQPKKPYSQDEYREIIKEAYKEGVRDGTQNGQPEDEKNLPVKYYHEERQAQLRSPPEDSERKKESKQRYDAIVARQDIEILRAKTVFPFTLFPDTLIIDTTKITVVRKQFFATEHITTIPLKDLADAQVQTALFLASLTVDYMPQSKSPGMIKPVTDEICCLRRTDAIRAKNILKGALVAKAEDIDIAKLTPEEVVNVVERFGRSEGVE